MTTTQKNKKSSKRQRTRYFVKPMSDLERFWTNRLKAVIYVRVSSDGQVNQGHGLESQESACRERCQRQHGMEIEIVKVFREEGVSGKLMDRKAMNEAIKFLEKENKKFTQIHYFVVTDADRIARPDDIAEAFTLEQSIEGLGVKIVTVNNKRDMESDEGKFLHTIQYAIAWLERRKILRRIMNGKLSSLKSGGRPFANPPLGYVREKLSEGNGYIDIIDPVKGRIIKEGLEHYALSSVFSKSQLHQYRVKKGLHTTKSKGKLYISFIEKTFRDYRLYFYAGYIYYPEWGLETPIQWKHEPLVSLDIIQKIMEKEISKSPLAKPSKTNDLEKHLLKGMITCSFCGRKLGCYASRWNGWTYFYYTCGNKYCSQRINIRKDVMEKQFEEFIDKMKIPKDLFCILKQKMDNRWTEDDKNKEDRIPHIQGQILSIQVKMKKIEDKILSITNEWLIKRLEDEWSTLEDSQKKLKNKLTSKKNDEDSIKATFLQAELLFTDPVKMWRNSNFETRQLMTMVWFSGILYYEKNQWYRTNDTTGLNYVFSPKWDDNSHVLAKGGKNPNQPKLSKAKFEAIFNALITQSQYINAIHKLKEMK